MSNLWVTAAELGTYATSEYAFEAAQTASFILWGLSGRKWSGTTTITEEYTPEMSTHTLRDILVNPVLINTAQLVGGFPDEPGSRFRLKGRPIQSITAVKYLDGTVIPATAYYVTDHTTINFKHLLTQGVFITYVYGAQPPTAGRMAARTLAIQFAMLWSGDDDCELPARVTSVSRQGVSFTILDNQDFIAELRTGVYAVDLFLKTVNPDKARTRSRIFSPDLPRGRRRS